MSEVPPDDYDESLASPPQEPYLVARGSRAHFIPIRKADLVERLAADSDLGSADRQQFLQLCRLLEATFHFQYHDDLEALKRCYVPFDPDLSAAVQSTARAATPRQLDELFDRVTALLERANYQRLAQEDLTGAVRTTSAWGVKLEVDFDVYERLEVFVRGHAMGQQSLRRLRNAYRREAIDVPTYQRLVILFRLRNHKWVDRQMKTDPAYLKLFKNIPKLDLEMLLPGTKVRMTLLDQGRILLPAVSGIAITVYKAIKGALVLAYAGVYGILAFLGMVAGTFGYGLKSFLGYQRARDKYRLNLTRNLYYQNLDNNAGVLFRLLDEAEEQEFIEAALAYFLLWRRSDANGWTVADLDEQAERYLRGLTGLDVDFEVHDALRKLQRMGLVQETADARVTAMPIDRALTRLDAAWDDFFRYSPDPDADSETLAWRATSPPRRTNEAA